MSDKTLRCVHNQLLRFVRTEDDNDWCDVCDGTRPTTPSNYGPCPCGSNVAVADGT